ncbi:AOC1-like protein [Mya arenaria]|uniref:Amine oxidase n=1 Tax=Mya arenaria TaxID=6604 RepID=A0ABY7FNJ0_MYAAR|nr:amiloride-sensitive amine oxidase [copper-containing]-like [Mya arenaria]XP_052770599.1 amiloride-sensitive amine oxidase [copper-containing]-like [Mya arenaria]WAR22253.1 AOC1-like protein [Mya arenaria]
MIELTPLPRKDPEGATFDVIEEESEPDANGDAPTEEDDSSDPLAPTSDTEADCEGSSGHEASEPLCQKCPKCSPTCVAISSGLVSMVLVCVVVIMAFHLGAVHYCIFGHTRIFRDTDDSNRGVFEDLSPNEYKSVRDYMFETSKIGLVPITKAFPNQSYIYLIDLHIPLKTSVLEHLDRGSVRLKRVAKVVVIRGNLESPRVEEYLVSPLPVPTSHRLARNPLYARYPVPYTSRPMDQVDYRFVYPIISQFTKEIYHILMDSYGLCYHNCTKGINCMLFRDTAPSGLESGDRITWFRAYRDVDGYFLHPLGLEIQIDHKSTDISDWMIERIMYNGHLIYTVSDFIERYNTGQIKKVSLLRPVGRPEDLYSSYHRRGTSEMPHPLRPPRLMEPDGNRFTITNQHVQYMHWDLDVRMRPSTGLQIFDVRFQGERLAYEISLQDAVVFSSGYGPAQMISNLYLASWMIGASSFELVRGVDCPDTASFLDLHHFVNSDEPMLYRKSVCVFEQDPGIPLRRHYEDDLRNGYRRYGGLVDYHLVVRHIATIQSSDYIFDYIFHLNGEIQLRVSLTGYVQATYDVPFESPYGNPLYFGVAGNVLQTVFHFKTDLDIRRVENRFAILEIKKETQRHPWYPGLNKTQFRLKKHSLLREMDLVVGDFPYPNYYLLFDENPTNQYGTHRSYRIINEGVTPFLLDDVNITNAANWVKYPVIVTKYDDTEDHSSSIYAQNDPWDPVVDFERFVNDNDTIVNEDLVIWAAVGIYHVPSTEDVPSTSTSSQSRSLRLVPYNFFTEDPSVSSPNTVQIIPDGEDIKVNMFGTSDDVSCAPQSLGPQTFYGYRADD